MQKLRMLLRSHHVRSHFSTVAIHKDCGLKRTLETKRSLPVPFTGPTLAEPGTKHLRGNTIPLKIEMAKDEVLLEQLADFHSVYTLIHQTLNFCKMRFRANVNSQSICELTLAHIAGQ